MPSERGLVVGKFAPLHSGHQLVLDTADNESDDLTVLVYSVPDFPAMPSVMRAEWVRRLYPDARVLVPEDPPPNDAPDRTHQAYVAAFLRDAGIEVDAVFTSEAYGDNLATVLTGVGRPVRHRLVDMARSTFPISGREIRADVHSHRAWLDPAVYADFVELVVLLGAESTGKSTLAAALAEAFATTSVAEFGREVWEEQHGKLTLDDYVHIATRHRELEDEAMLDANRYVFVDTNALTTMLLCYAYEGHGLPALTELARSAERRYAHVFLCADDIPFEQDGWRDDEAWRSRAQGLVRFDLAARGIEYVEIGGPLDDRINQISSVLTQRASEAHSRS